MGHDPVAEESQFGSAAVLPISFHPLEHTIEPFECEEPPRIDRTKQLEHREVMDRHMMVNHEVDAEHQTCLRVFAEKFLS